MIIANFIIIPRFNDYTNFYTVYIQEDWEFIYLRKKWPCIQYSGVARKQMLCGHNMGTGVNISW